MRQLVTYGLVVYDADLLLWTCYGEKRGKTGVMDVGRDTYFRRYSS